MADAHSDDQRSPLGDDASELTTQQLNTVPPQESSAFTTQQLNVVGPGGPPGGPVQQPPESGYAPPPDSGYAPQPAQPGPFAPPPGYGPPQAPPPGYGSPQAPQPVYGPPQGAPSQPLPQPPQPPQPPQTRSFAPKVPRDRRRLLIIGLVVVVVLGGGGLTWALWPSKSKAPVASSPQHVVPGTLQASILTPDDISKAVGTTVISGSAVNQPPAALTADPASCAMAVGPATVSGYTKGWTVFYSTTYQDSGGTGDYTVTQTIGDYGDPGQAGTVFQALGQGIAACPSATRTDQNKNTVKWNYSVGANTPNQLAWTAAQDAGGGWACYRQARLKGAAVLQVAICEGGDGKAAVAKVADAFAAKVSG